MTDLDAEMVAYAVLQDARMLGNATPQQLSAALAWLVETQDQIARAIEKARLVTERQAA